MTPPKIVVYGNSDFPVERLSAIHNSPVEISPVPAGFPTDRLEYLAPFHLVLLNYSSESEDNLEQIRMLRRQYSTVPVILASSNPSASYLVQAYRYGITDCLLAPFSEEQLRSVVASYLIEPEQSIGHQAPKPMPQVLRSNCNPFNANEEADFSICFLKTFQLFHKGERLDLPGGARQRSLLAYLFFQGQNLVHRDKIIQQFWPDHDPDCAKNNLNVAICNLRRYLEQFTREEVICFQNGYFFLNQHLLIQRDIDNFLQAYQQGRAADSRGQAQVAAKWFQTAAQLGSEFLEEFMQEDWTRQPREEFTEKLFHAQDKLSSHQIKCKSYETALTTLRHMLYKDDCLESVHNKIMNCYLALGKNEKAVRQYQDCERILLEKLKMRPTAETETLYHAARRHALVA